jgi:hypothetical protein
MQQGRNHWSLTCRGIPSMLRVYPIIAESSTTQTTITAASRSASCRGRPSAMSFMVTGLQSSWSMVIKKLMVFFIKYFVDFLWQLFYFVQKMAKSREPVGTRLDSFWEFPPLFMTLVVATVEQ